VNERVSHYRVVSGVPRDAQTPVYRPHISVNTLKCVLNPIGCTRRCEEELESDGYSVMVSAEGHSLVNEQVSYHRVVLGVLRDA
jgi:hypothetical protein